MANDGAAAYAPSRAVPSGLRPVGSAPAKSHRAQVNRPGIQKLELRSEACV